MRTVHVSVQITKVVITISRGDETLVIEVPIIEKPPGSNQVANLRRLSMTATV